MDRLLTPRLPPCRVICIGSVVRVFSLRRPRTWAFVLLLVFTVGAFLGHGQTCAAEGDAGSAPPGRLVVGGDHNYPPFEFLDANNRPAGYAVDLTRAIAEAMGVEVEIRLGPWSEMRAALHRGDLDALQGVFYSEPRTLELAFTPPHLIIDHALYAHLDAPQASSLDDLSGHTVVVQQGDLMHEYLLAHRPGIHLVPVDNQVDALRLVAAGQFPFAVVNRLSAQYALRELGLRHVQPVGDPFRTALYCYAVRADDEAGLALFAEGLRRVQESGEHQRIQDRWLVPLHPHSVSYERMLRILALALTPLLLLTGIGLLWSASLRRQISHRTADLRAEISERRRIELSLTESQRRYHALFAQTPNPVLVIDPRQRVLDVNEAAARFLDSSREALIDTPIQALMAPSQDEVIWQPQHPPGVDEPSIEVQFLVHGQIKVLEVTVSSVSWHGQHAIVASGRDMTQQKRSERLLNALNKASLTMEQAMSPRGIYQAVARELDALDLDCLIYLLNESGDTLRAEDWGYLPRRLRHLAENKGVYWYEIAVPLAEIDVYRQSLETRSAHIEDTLELAEAIAHSWQPLQEIRAQAQEVMAGTRVVFTPLLVEGEPLGLLAVLGDNLTADDVPAILAFGHQLAAVWHKTTLMAELAQSLNELQRTQAELLQVQKMEAVGRLAGGVAHDFNNLLTIINGYSQLLLRQLPEPSAEHTETTEILKAGERAADLTRRLLAFSRQQMVQRRVLDLNTVLTSMEQMVARLIGEDIRLQFRLAEQSLPILADAGQIEQVLLNLAVNARDAMPEGGALTVETGRTVLLQGHHALQLDPGDYVTLSVTDTGQGIPDEVIERLFEPFFTTKPQGQGTGLGLSIVYGIVQQNEGDIEVLSEMGVGTTFRLYFPAVTDSTPSASASRQRPQRPPAQGTVLFVEDEGPVRELAAKVLEQEGYCVLTAADAQQALALHRQLDGAIDLLITDVVMPEMSGRQLADILLSAHAELCVLFITGYAREALGSLDPGDAKVSLLRKPFGPDELVDKVREILSVR